MSSFGERLLECRKAAGLTQEELAALCGTHKQNISRYETSKREPQLDTAAIIATVLGVSLEYLYYGKEKDEPFPQVTMIGRAAERMTEEQREKMLLLLRVAFPEEFSD